MRPESRRNEAALRSIRDGGDSKKKGIKDSEEKPQTTSKVKNKRKEKLLLLFALN